MRNMQNDSELKLMDDLAVSHVSHSLQGKRIALCCCGGIAAIDSPKVARSLRRRGASVEAWATENALKFVGIASLEWATSKPVVTSPSGMAEHISTHDCILVCNATADVIAKAAQGICSDGVTTLIQSAMGLKIPVIFLQTMHESLAHSPIVQRNCEILRAFDNVSFLKPRIEESKLKIRPHEEIADEVSHIVNKHKFAGRIGKTLLTMGGTRVALDSVRAISNRSSGRLGLALLKELYRWGLAVDVFVGEATVDLPSLDGVSIKKVPSYEQMYSAVKNICSADYSGVFMLAAVSDFITEQKHAGKEKISSKRETIDVHLVRSSKIVALDSFQRIPFRFTCKLTQDDGHEAQEAIERLLAASNSHYIFWNTVTEAFGKEDDQQLSTRGKTIGRLIHCDRLTKSPLEKETTEIFATKEALCQKIVSIFIQHVENCK